MKTVNNTDMKSGLKNRINGFLARLFRKVYTVLVSL
jgi:hypothetical protein